MASFNGMGFNRPEARVVLASATLLSSGTIEADIVNTTTKYSEASIQFFNISGFSRGNLKTVNAIATLNASSTITSISSHRTTLRAALNSTSSIESIITSLVTAETALISKAFIEAIRTSLLNAQTNLISNGLLQAYITKISEVSVELKTVSTLGASLNYGETEYSKAALRFFNGTGFNRDQSNNWLRGVATLVSESLVDFNHHPITKLKATLSSTGLIRGNASTEISTAETEKDAGFNFMGFNRRFYTGTIKYFPPVDIRSTGTIQATTAYIPPRPAAMRFFNLSGFNREPYEGRVKFLGQVELVSDSLIEAKNVVEEPRPAAMRQFNIMAFNRDHYTGRIRHVTANLTSESIIETDGVDPSNIRMARVGWNVIDDSLYGFNSMRFNQKPFDYFIPYIFSRSMRWFKLTYLQGSMRADLKSESLISAVCTRRKDAKAKDMISESYLLKSTVERRRSAKSKLRSETYFLRTWAQPTLSDAIDALSREWAAEVEVYFDGPDKPPVIFKHPYVAEFVLLEELKAESHKHIIGSVSANELDLTLANVNRVLSSTNKQGPYYGKLLPNTMIKLRIALSLDYTWIYFNLGTFYTDDWDDTSSAPVVNVRAYDRYYQVSQRDFAGTRMLKDITYYALFEILFKAIGLATSEYIIDATLRNTKVKYGWIPQGTFAYGAQYLTQASNSFMYLNRDNKFVVQSLQTKNVIRSAVLHDKNQVVNMQIPTSYNQAFSKLEINVVDPVLLEQEEIILEFTDLPVSVGTTALTHCKYTKTPASAVSKIIIQGKTTRLERYSASTDSISMWLTNTGATEVVNIQVWGMPVVLNTKQHIAESATMLNILGSKVLQIENPAIQDYAYAQEIANSIFPVMVNPNAHTKLQIRGNPRILPGTIIDAESATDKIDKQKVLVYRSTLTYQGGISQSLQGFNLT